MLDRQDATGAADRLIRLDSGSALDDLVSTRDLFLVEFVTEGCGICASMEPVLGNVARATDATIGIVNPRDDPPLVERFDVRSVPLFVLFQAGQPVARLADGFVGAEELVEWIEANRD